MKLLKKSDITPVAPHGDAQLYRYQDLLDGVNVILSEQAPHTARSGGTPVACLVMVLSGQLDVVCGEEQFAMGAGDAASFEPMEERTMTNNGDEAVLLLLVDTGKPGGGAGGPGGGPGGPPPAQAET